jgi:hypothetical protein
MDPDPTPTQLLRAAPNPSADLAAALRHLLARLDASIAAGALSRAEAIEIAECLYDRLNELFGELAARRRRRLQ